MKFKNLFSPSSAGQPGKGVRILLPILLIIIWVAFGGFGGPYFGKIAEVSSNSPTDFLPASADATKVQNIAAQFRDTSAIPAIVVIESNNSTLSAEDRSWGNALQQRIGKLEGVDSQVSPVIPSKDGKALQIVALIDTKAEIKTVVEAIRAEAKQLIPKDVETYVAGPAGFTADLAEAFSGIDGLLLIVALSVVLVILLIVYRSPILPFLVLLTSMFALSASVLVVWWLAKWNIVQINGQVQGILFILVIGAATDYSLLYVSRFREAIRHTPAIFDATITALKGSFEPILASGGTVIAGLLCLLLSDLNSNKFLGPVSAIGIVFAILSALTLLPSLLALTGKFVFWPLQPRYDAELKPNQYQASRIWSRLSQLIDTRPRALWVVVTVALLVSSVGLTQLRADGVPDSEIIVGASESRDGQNALARHFAAGSGSPMIIIADVDKLEAVVAEVEQADGVASVEAIAKDSPSGTVPLGENRVMFGPLASAAPTVINNRIMLQATLEDQPDSTAAENVVNHLRSTLPQIDENAKIGGPTATNLDTRAASIHDRNTIIPVVLLVITFILMILLRSIIAPILLILTTVLSFMATLGVGSFVFTDVWNMPGADPSVPLYAFIFLVALGIDYNIFLMTRVREEALTAGNRLGILRGLVVTGGVITSAGVVLAATFAALGVIPILFLVQLAFLVSFGVLLDTFVVRSLLVPALIRDLGPFSWWPSRLRHKP